MDVPKPPDEPEVKNIIDKLANFVARNGVEFEKMTKEKQRGNQKFSFLFGGEHYNYYQYRLSTEQQIQNQQKAKLAAQVVAQEAIVQHSLQNAPWQQQNPNVMPPLMPPFPQFPVQMQQQMGMRMPPPNVLPWQQNQGMPQQPPLGMPPFPQPSSAPNMGPMAQPPAQAFPNRPSGNQGEQNMLSQQVRPPPQNFPMFQQPPPMLPPQQQLRNPPMSAEQGPPPIAMQDAQDSTGQPMSALELEERDFVKAKEDADKKIEESKNNLNQQYDVLMQKQQEKIEVAIGHAQEDKLKNLAATTGITLSDFDSVLQPVINTCTKDSISAGKSWILSNGKTANHCEVVARYLLKKVTDAEKPSLEVSNAKSKFDTQLHLVYLINDVLHHASKKHLTELSNALQSVILPIFCMANANAPEARKERLTKLLGLWEKFKYFSEEILNKLKDPAAALSEYQANLIIQHAAAVQQVQADIQKQFGQYQQQHDQYASHIEQQVENKKRSLETRRAESKKAHLDSKCQENQNISQGQEYQNRQKKFDDFDGGNPPWGEGGNFDSNQAMQFDYGHGSSNNQQPQVIDYSHQRTPSEWQEEEFPNQQWGQGPRGPRMKGPWHEGAAPPWGQGGGPRPRGPPRGPPPPMDPNDPSLIPTVPYYDLPAGLMCPLVKLEDMDYKPIDPATIRLPPPIPPSERLLAAVEAFYAPPSRDRPRNVDGWEHNGLFEFYRAKARAKRRKDGENISRSRSKSKSRSRSRSRSRQRSYSRSSSSSRSRSRSRSKSRSRSSRSRSRSRSPRRRGDSRRGRSRSPRRRERSATPKHDPNFSQAREAEGKLGDENRGAQMLKRMGWGGAGLGANEQGIEDPVAAGDVREKYDMYKGLGMPMNDPFESFRKSKSQGFITRIKARDKERERKKELCQEDTEKGHEKLEKM